MSSHSAPDPTRSGRFSRWSWSLRLLIVVAIVGQGIAATHTPARAQAAEDSTEEATIALLPYLFQPEEAPAGYTLTTTVAYPSEAQAFEAVMIPPPDPRPMEALLSQLVDAGRIVRLRQGFENHDNLDAPEIGYSVAEFSTPEQALAAEHGVRAERAARQPEGGGGRRDGAQRVVGEEVEDRHGVAAAQSPASCAGGRLPRWASGMRPP